MELYDTWYIFLIFVLIVKNGTATSRKVSIGDSSLSASIQQSSNTSSWVLGERYLCPLSSSCHERLSPPPPKSGTHEAPSTPKFDPRFIGLESCGDPGLSPFSIPRPPDWGQATF